MATSERVNTVFCTQTSHDTMTACSVEESAERKHVISMHRETPDAECTDGIMPRAEIESES